MHALFYEVSSGSYSIVNSVLKSPLEILLDEDLRYKCITVKAYDPIAICLPTILDTLNVSHPQFSLHMPTFSPEVK